MTTTTAIRVQSASAGATEPDNITAINPTGPGVGMLLQVQNLITTV